MIFVLHIWISVMIITHQHPNNRETGYSNVLGEPPPLHHGRR